MALHVFLPVNPLLSIPISLHPCLLSPLSPLSPLSHPLSSPSSYSSSSDDRSAELFYQKLEATTQMQAVLTPDCRPTCLIIDEIDGAPVVGALHFMYVHVCEIGITFGKVTRLPLHYTYVNFVMIDRCMPTCMYIVGCASYCVLCCPLPYSPVDHRLRAYCNSYSSERTG